VKYIFRAVDALSGCAGLAAKVAARPRPCTSEPSTSWDTNSWQKLCRIREKARKTR